MVDVANQIEVLEHKAVTLKRQVSHAPLLHRTTNLTYST